MRFELTTLVVIGTDCVEFGCDLQQVRGFLRYSGFSTNKTDRHEITEILLKVTLNTTILTLTP